MSSTTTTTRPAIAARKPLGHLGASHLDSAAQFHAVPPRIGKHLSLQLLASRAWRSIGTIVAIREKKKWKSDGKPLKIRTKRGVLI